MKPAKNNKSGKLARKKKSQSEPVVRFELKLPAARTVCIAGTFNDWHPGATEMVDLGEGRWVKELALAPGVYEYLFVVDGEWREDSHAMARTQNPFGGRNSVIQVDAT